MDTNIKIKRQKLLRKCGLPDVPETQHCFADSTHHTCCMLGTKAREYADSSGNPIGALSVQVQGSNASKASKSNNEKLVPWCTCTGSKVCSYYSSKFGNVDGTHIKFIGTLKPKGTRNGNKRNKKNKTRKNDGKNAGKNTREEWNEDNAIQQLGLMQHRTSGIN
jgi:hypothetical protein